MAPGKAVKAVANKAATAAKAKVAPAPAKKPGTAGKPDKASKAPAAKSSKKTARHEEEEEDDDNDAWDDDVMDDDFDGDGDDFNDDEERAFGSDDEAADDFDNDEEGDEVEDEDEDEDEEEEAAAPKKAKKPDAKPTKSGKKEAGKKETSKKEKVLKTSAEAHQDKKKKLEERKSQRKHADLVEAAVNLWEKLRVKDLDEAKRAELISQILTLTRGKILEVRQPRISLPEMLRRHSYRRPVHRFRRNFTQVALKHDVSRVIQSCLKYGTAEQREQIVKELLGHFVQLSTSPYARRITLKVMKYCPNHHRRIIQEFQGHMLRMLRHKVCQQSLGAQAGDYRGVYIVHFQASSCDWTTYSMPQ